MVVAGEGDSGGGGGGGGGGGNGGGGRGIGSGGPGLGGSPPLPTTRGLSAVDIADITATAVNAVTHSISAVTAVHTSSAPDTVFITLYPLKLLHLRI